MSAPVCSTFVWVSLGLVSTGIFLAQKRIQSFIALDVIAQVPVPYRTCICTYIHIEKYISSSIEITNIPVNDKL